MTLATSIFSLNTVRIRSGLLLRTSSIWKASIFSDVRWLCKALVVHRYRIRYPLSAHSTPVVDLRIHQLARKVSTRFTFPPLCRAGSPLQWLLLLTRLNCSRLTDLRFCFEGCSGTSVSPLRRQVEILAHIGHSFSIVAYDMLLQAQVVVGALLCIDSVQSWQDLSLMLPDIRLFSWRSPRAWRWRRWSLGSIACSHGCPEVPAERRSDELLDQVSAWSRCV